MQNNYHTQQPAIIMDIIVEPALLKLQREALEQRLQTQELDISPISRVRHSGHAEDKLLGHQLLAEGAMGCIVVAGGQGTRLRYEGPKGLYPISPVENKTLFQLIAEKTLAASHQAGKDLPLAVMTSTQNHEETVRYFQEHQFFGLKPDQVSFFSQALLPFLNLEGNPFLESPEAIACGPDGNGHVLTHFVQSGLWEQWQKRGVRFVNFILIDNPLADPFDTELLGYHARQQADVTIKCTTRMTSSEKVGLLVEINGKTHVIEYTEAPTEKTSQILPDGSLAYNYANLSLFCFSMDFIRQSENFTMPLHASLKAAKFLDENGQTQMSEEPIAWKFEWFIFDVLPFAQNVQTLAYYRNECFSPLKNMHGTDSPETVKAALSAYDRKIFEELSGCPVSFDPFELAARFHYPTPELIEEWKGKPAPASYVP